MTVAGCLSAGPDGNDVVHVLEVQQGSYAGLSAKDIDKISELRKGSLTADALPVNAIVKETRKYTVTEYMSEYPELVRQGGVDYTVGGNDVLNIIVYDEGNLTRNGVRVSGEGYISYPLIGRIKVDGLTTSQIEDLLVQKLAEGEFLLDAQVTVMIEEYGSKRYKVLGAVKSPGIYPLKAEERVLDAISSAGGVDSEIGAKNGMIIRIGNPLGSGVSDKKAVINIDLDNLLKGTDQISNMALVDQDVIYIPKAELFYIMGQVKEPGSYKFTEMNMTLVEAIGTAGGFTAIAGRNKTRIIRVEDGVEKVITVNVDAITSAGRKIQDVQIKPGDIIVVPESFF